MTQPIWIKEPLFPWLQSLYTLWAGLTGEMMAAASTLALAALLLCGATRADQAMIAGEWRVKDGSITGLDLPALMARHHQLGLKLQARAV